MKKSLFRGLAANVCVLVAVAAYTPSVAQAAGQAPKCSTAKLIVPWKAGGGTQVIFAIFEKVVQQMNVDSKIKLVMIPGQGGNKGAKEAAKSKPDGCTLFAIHQKRCYQLSQWSDSIPLQQLRNHCAVDLDA